MQKSDAFQIAFLSRRICQALTSFLSPSLAFAFVNTCHSCIARYSLTSSSSHLSMNVSQSPTISLVLTGGHRINLLSRFLLSLAQQTLSPNRIQLIFVNQNPLLSLSSIVESVNYSFVQINVDAMPLSNARNIGLSRITGSVVGFPDDDCWYKPSLLADVFTFLEQHPHIDTLCTNVFDPIANQVYGSRPLGYNCRITTDNIFRLPISVGTFIRAHSFLRAGCFFDTRLGAGCKYGSGEETELIYRLIKSGAFVFYSGSISVFHEVPAYQPKDISKFFAYGRGFGFVVALIVVDGCLNVCPYYFEILSRSLAGFLLNISKPSFSIMYLGRGLGSVIGFLAGLSNKYVSSPK